MNTSTTPSLQHTITEIKRYLLLHYKWLKLDGIEKLTRIISAIVLIFISIIFITIILLYLSLSAAHAMEPHIGPVATYAIIAGIFLVLFLLVWILRRPCVVNPILRFLYRIFSAKEGKNELFPDQNDEL